MWSIDNAGLPRTSSPCLYAANFFVVLGEGEKTRKYSVAPDLLNALCRFTRTSKHIHTISKHIDINIVTCQPGGGGTGGFRMYLPRSGWVKTNVNRKTAHATSVETRLLAASVFTARYILYSLYPLPPPGAHLCPDPHARVCAQPTFLSFSVKVKGLVNTVCRQVCAMHCGERRVTKARKHMPHRNLSKLDRISPLVCHSSHDNHILFLRCHRSFLCKLAF